MLYICMYMYMHDKQFLAQAVSLSYTYSLYKTMLLLCAHL